MGLAVRSYLISQENNNEKTYLRHVLRIFAVSRLNCNNLDLKKNNNNRGEGRLLTGVFFLPVSDEIRLEESG